MDANTQLRLLCVCVDQATFDPLISIVSIQTATSTLVLSAESPSSLFLSSPIHLSFPHFFCSAHIFDQAFGYCGDPTVW